MNATRTAARPPSQPADRATPHVRIPVSLDISQIKPAYLKMLLILEAFWGAKTYCWPSNETLAKKFGCSVSRARQILYEMEELGYIYLLPADPAKPHGERAGIFAHRRLNPDRPVEDRPPPPEAIDRLGAARAKSLGTGVPLVGIPTTPPVGIPTTPLVGIPTPSKEYSLSLNQTHSEPGVAPLDQRQRKDPPEPEPLPAVPTQETTAAVHPPIDPAPIAPQPEPAPIVAAGVAELPAEPPPAAAEPTDPAGAAEALTAGQEAFLATLDADQRAAFDALPADRRADILAPHALGYDRVIGADQVVKLSPPRRVELPPLPTTTEELIEQLPGSPRERSQQAAEALAQDFGEKRDRQLWGEFRKIAEVVRRGQVEAGDMLNAYRQAMAPGIERPGAKFWAAFKGLTRLDEGDLKALIAGREVCHVT
jgi:hypothetical protein